MRPLLFLSLLLILNLESLSAQNKATDDQPKDYKKTTFGMLSGLNLSNINTDDDLISTSTQIFFHAGFLLEFRLNKHWAIQPELQYSVEGSSIKYSRTIDATGNTADEEGILRFEYITVPIMAKYYFTDRFSLNAGFRLGYLASARRRVNILDNAGSVDNIIIENNVKEDITDFNFATSFGASYKVSNNVFLSANYSLGLMDILKDENSSIKTNSIQISIGYLFP